MGVGGGVDVEVEVRVAIITGLDRGCTAAAWATVAGNKVTANKTKKKTAKVAVPVLFK